MTLGRFYDFQHLRDVLVYLGVRSDSQFEQAHFLVNLRYYQISDEVTERRRSPLGIKTGDEELNIDW